VEVVGVLWVDGKAQDAELLELCAVAGCASAAADKIEKLRPAVSVVGCFVKASDVGAGIDDIVVVRIIKDSIDESTAADGNVLPVIDSQQNASFESLDPKPPLALDQMTE